MVWLDRLMTHLDQLTLVTEGEVTLRINYAACKSSWWHHTFPGCTTKLIYYFHWFSPGDVAGQHPPHVLVVPSPSDVLLWGTWTISPSGEWFGWVESPSGEWMVGAVSVLWHIDQLPQFVGLNDAFRVTFQTESGTNATSYAHQHWVPLQLLHWMIHWLNALD